MTTPAEDPDYRAALEEFLSDGMPHDVAVIRAQVRARMAKEDAELRTMGHDPDAVRQRQLERWLNPSVYKKRCSACRRDLLAEAFSPDRSRNDRLTRYCKECQAEHARMRRSGQRVADRADKQQARETYAAMRKLLAQQATHSENGNDLP